MKGGEILDFWKGETLRKKGVDLENWSYDPLPLPNMIQ